MNDGRIGRISRMAAALTYEGGVAASSCTLLHAQARQGRRHAAGPRVAACRRQRTHHDADRGDDLPMQAVLQGQRRPVARPLSAAAARDSTAAAAAGRGVRLMAAGAVDVDDAAVRGGGWLAGSREDAEACAARACVHTCITFHLYHAYTQGYHIPHPLHAYMHAVHAE